MKFGECWERINNVLGVKNFAQLAEIIGQTPASVTKRKKQDEFPVEWAYKVAKKYGVLTEWVLSGEGPRRISENELLKESVPTEEWSEDEEEYVECNWNRKFIKKVPVIKGALYEVDPLNPNKKKLKGERVILIESDFIGPVTCLRIDSEWHKKRRNYTEMDLCDLRFISRNIDIDKLD